MQWLQQINEGTLILDERQRPIIEALDDMFIYLKKNKKQKFSFNFKKKEPLSSVKGLYIWGTVGRGKSMLMDLFAANIKTYTPYSVLRQHFHEFMRYVQQQLVKNREAYRSFDNPLIPLAKEIAQQNRILCFDEFQVTNIADAMVLGRLFEALFMYNVIIIATSNIAPDDLYKDGLHRSRFLPFIEILKIHMHVFQMGGNEDFRYGGDILEDAWISPLSEENIEKFNHYFYKQSGSSGEKQSLTVDGRHLPLIKTAQNIAMVDFHTLCRQPRGTADYIALGEAFHTLYLMNIPRLSAEGAAVRRFIHLIDILYEKRVRLHMLAECKLEELSPPASAAPSFFRTVSRLAEMRSQQWQAHSFNVWFSSQA